MDENEKIPAAAESTAPEAAEQTPVALPELLTVSPSPHARRGVTTSHLMRDVILALMPATLWGLYVFGGRAALVILTCVVSCVVFVDVGLAGTHAIIGNLFHRGRQEETETDSGKSPDLGIFCRIYIQADLAVREDGDLIVHPQNGLNGHGAD